MALSNFNRIAHYNAKLLVRSWLFRFFLLLTFSSVLLIHFTKQSDMGDSPGVITLASFIPYMNAYWFTILQTLSVLFLSGMFLNRESKLDSMDTIYYRPESNVEYIWGVCWGFARVFLSMAVVSLFLGVLVHLFASSAPFNGWLYLFYLVTLVFPALVFMLGFSFLIFSWVRNLALSIWILLGYVLITVLYLGEVQQGLFDPFGLILPNAFSGITGHPDLGGYLLQRGCWLLVGLGCIGFTVIRFKRLPNAPRKQRQQVWLTGGFFVAGAVLGIVAFSLHQQDVSRRAAYTETYNKYEKEPKMTLLSQDISYEQRGRRMVVASRLKMENRTPGDVPEVILYLNPALKVVSLCSGGEALPYHRDHQVIRVQKGLSAGQQCDIEVKYEGRIDEYICYLDVVDEAFWDMSYALSHACRYGKRYTYLTRDFTLLTPECLWYPVTVPPVNPASPYAIPKNFARYTLEVLSRPDRVAISQGEREEVGDRTVFRNRQSLHGLSLCIGEYEKRELTVDSTGFELYLFRGHGDILEGWEMVNDTLPTVISAMKSRVESNMGKRYPFDRFRMVETPVTLASYYRYSRGGSELVQPEMVCIPERGVGHWTDFAHMKKQMELRALQKSSTVLEEMAVEMPRLTAVFTNQYNLTKRRVFTVLSMVFPAKKSPSDFYIGNNILALHPMFYNYTSSIQSDAYPMMDVILNLFLRDKNGGKIGKKSTPHIRFERDAISYLNEHSLMEAFDDTSMQPVVFNDILELKVNDLSSLFSVKGLSPKTIVAFLTKYQAKYAFQQTDFTHFNEEFVQHYGLNWMDLLPGWYTVNSLPVYWTKGLTMHRVKRSSGESCLYTFSVYNDSDVDGVVSFSYTIPNSTLEKDGDIRISGIEDGERVVYDYLIKARTGSKVSLLADMDIVFAMLNTDLSHNIPDRFSARWGDFAEDTLSVVQQIDKSYFMEPDEIVVDNEDDGFQVDQPYSRSKLQHWFNRHQASTRYHDVFTLKTVGKGEWEPYIDPNNYGLSGRSAMVKLSGKGNYSVKWNARIEREGVYEVFAYIVTTPQSSQDKTMERYFTVYSKDGVQEVVTDIYMKGGWISLGKFYYTPGECKVSLSDKGKADQLIIGDAVKWVYLGDKKVK